MLKLINLLKILPLILCATILGLNTLKADINFDASIYKNREANAKLIQYVHQRITGAINMDKGLKLYEKSYFFAHGMHGPADWNTLIFRTGGAEQPHDYLFFLKLIQNQIISIKHIKYNTYQITVGETAFNFFLYGAEKKVPQLFNIRCHKNNPQYLASLVISATKFSEATGENHVKVEGKNYPFKLINAVADAKNKLFTMIKHNYPQMTVPAGIIQALKDHYLTIQSFDAMDRSKLKISINNIEICSLQIESAEEQHSLQNISANFNDYEINKQKTVELLSVLEPAQVHFTWERPENNIIIATYDTVTYNRFSFPQLPTNANADLLIDMDGARVGVEAGRGYIINLLKTAFYGEPLLAAGQGEVTPEFQVKLNLILRDFAKVLAQMTDKEKQRNAVLTLAAAANHCATSIAFNLSQIVTNLSADYLSGCKNMVVAELERMRTNLLTAAVLAQHPNIYQDSQNAHTFCKATKQYGLYYMLAHTGAAQFDDNYSNLARGLSDYQTKQYFNAHYTPETMVRFLQDELMTSEKKYNNKTIYELMAEWAVATKLAPNGPTFAQKYCDQEWPQDEDCDVPNDKFMLYLLLKTELIKRK